MRNLTPIFLRQRAGISFYVGLVFKPVNVKKLALLRLRHMELRWRQIRKLSPSSVGYIVFMITASIPTTNRDCTVIQGGTVVPPMFCHSVMCGFTFVYRCLRPFLKPSIFLSFYAGGWRPLLLEAPNKVMYPISLQNRDFPIGSRDFPIYYRDFPTIF